MTDSLGRCRELLPRVSRSFALGIQTLPQPFEAWVTAAYLLCRVADTVEDAPDLSWTQRRQMFLDFEDTLTGGSPAAFQAAVHRLPAGDDQALCAELHHVLALSRSFSPEIQKILHTWVGEMTYGMATYARRHTPGSRTTLYDADDLLRYCWYVAGTVGHMLTDLFVAGFPALGEQEGVLRRRATSFGLLLQMTNIVKDVTDDWARGWCFIPDTMQRAAGVPEGKLMDPAHRTAAQAAVDTVNQMARSYYKDAVAYCTALPPDAEACRRFCLFPMLMSGRTLDLALHNPATLIPGTPIKVSREIVAEEVARTETLIQNDVGIAALSLTTAA